MPKIEVKPLSVNNCWQGKRFKTNEYKAYEKEMLYRLPKIKIPEPPYKVYYEFGFSSAASDLDNPVKPLQDILQKKYKFDDKNIHQMLAERVKVKKGEEYLIFEIEHYDKEAKEKNNLIMSNEDNKSPLWAKFLEIRKAVPYLENDKAGYNDAYTYTSSTKIIATLNEHLNNHGIMLHTSVTGCDRERVMKKRKYEKNGQVTWVDHYETLYIVNMMMTWTNVATGEEIHVPWMGSGSNGDEMGYGSALTYGKRYFLLHFFNIPTDEQDPESLQKELYKSEMSRVNLGERVEKQKIKDGVIPGPQLTPTPTKEAPQAEESTIPAGGNDPELVETPQVEGKVYTQAELDAFETWKELIPIIESLGGKKDDLEGRISKGKCISYILALQENTTEEVEKEVKIIEKPKKEEIPVIEVQEENKEALMELAGNTDFIVELANGERSKADATMVYRDFNKLGISQALVGQYRDQLGLKTTYPLIADVFVKGTVDHLKQMLGLHRESR
jgi:hypothetical protein